MPEDLRSKEDSLLAKKKTEFQPDIVRPGQLTGRGSRSQASGSGHWWQRWFRPWRFSFKRNRPSEDDDAILREVAQQNMGEANLARHDLQLEERRPVEYKLGETPKSKNPVKLEPEPREIEPVADQRIKQPQASRQPSPQTESVLNINWTPPRPVSETVPPRDVVLVPTPSPEAESVLDKPVAAWQLRPVADAVKPPAEKLEPRPVPTRPEPEILKPPPEVPPAKPAEIDEEASVKGPMKFHQPKPRIRARFLDEGGVDLIPTAARIKSSRQIVSVSLTSLLLAALVVGLFYGALYYQKNQIAQQGANQERQISDLEREILTFAQLNEEIKELGDDIRLVDSALNQHIYWTNFFSLLEKYTIPELYYKGFSAGNKGALTLQAVGADFYALARQLKILQQDQAKEFVVQADISSAELSEEGVLFDIVLILNPGLFYYKE